ncbi:MAG: flippase [Clostridia bacterium]|nr:flippase [Clostridia bacterium]
MLRASGALRERSFAQNYLFNLIYQILAIALPLVTTPYLSRVLGAQGIGQYSFAQSIVSYFALAAALGTTIYGQRQVARVKDRPEERSRLFFEILLFRVCGAVLACLIYCLTIMPRSSSPLLYAVAAIEILTVAVDITWFYQGMEDFAPIAVCTTVGRVLAMVGIFVFVKTKEDLVIYVCLYCASLLFAHLLSFFGLRRYIVRVRGVRIRLLYHLLPALALFVSQFAIQVYTVLDKTMIGLITGSDLENGYYEQSHRLVNVLMALVTSLGAVMASRVAVLWRTDRKEVDRLIYGSFRLIFALGLPLALGVVLILTRFVPIFYGPGFEPVIPIIQVFVLLFPILGCSNVIGIQYLVPTGREKLLTASVFAGALVNVVLNIFLIRAFAARGAAIASVIAELVVTTVQFYFVRREIRVLSVLKLLLRYGIFTAIMGGVGYAVSLVAPQGILGIALIVLPCVAVYGALLLVVRDPVYQVFKKSNTVGENPSEN